MDGQTAVVVTHRGSVQQEAAVQQAGTTAGAVVEETAGAAHVYMEKLKIRARVNFGVSDGKA